MFLQAVQSVCCLILQQIQEYIAYMGKHIIAHACQQLCLLCIANSKLMSTLHTHLLYSFILVSASKGSDRTPAPVSSYSTPEQRGSMRMMRPASASIACILPVALSSSPIAYLPQHKCKHCDFRMCLAILLQVNDGPCLCIPCFITCTMNSARDMEKFA